MRKLFFLFTALTLSAGLWAETINGVKYLDANGQEQTADNVTEITNSSNTLDAGWYVVKGNNVTTGSLTCNGAVHLILADGAKLTAMGDDHAPGIKVSEDGNSLTIYGQADQSGQLIATGGEYAAGIGGGYHGSGSNITINGGEVTANGGEEEAAGIGGGAGGAGSYITINGGTVTATGGKNGAGIGGGAKGSGFDITINGGTVTATGRDAGAGIGGGKGSRCYNIAISDGIVITIGGINAPGIGCGYGCTTPAANVTVAISLTVYADNTNPPTTEILHTGDSDIATFITKRYVTIKDVATGLKKDAIDAINATIDDADNDNVKAIAISAATAINATTSTAEINTIKTFALAAIASARAAYNSGQAELLGTMGTPCTGCTAVEVTDGTTTVRLYNPTKVSYIKVPSEE